MASPTESAAEPAWEPDDTETGPEMNDDDFDYDDTDDESPADGEAEDRVARATAVPVWRLIEMTRENRKLQEELADFEDYDGYDGIGEDCAGLSR